LVVEGVARAAGAGAQRVAALEHEAGDDAVEDDAVVERTGDLLAGLRVGELAGALGETHEVLDGLGCVVREQLETDVPVIGVKSCEHGVILAQTPVPTSPRPVRCERTRSRPEPDRSPGTCRAGRVRVGPHGLMASSGMPWVQGPSSARPDGYDRKGNLMALTKKRETKKAKKQAAKTAVLAVSTASRAEQAVAELQKLASTVGPA